MRAKCFVKLDPCHVTERAFYIYIIIQSLAKSTTIFRSVLYFSSCSDTFDFKHIFFPLILLWFLNIYKKKIINTRSIVECEVLKSETKEPDNDIDEDRKEDSGDNHKEGKYCPFHERKVHELAECKALEERRS